MRRLYISIMLLLLAVVNVSAQTTEYDTGKPIQIEGTDLAKLPSIMDVLEMLPGVTVHDDVVTVIGRGEPSIYIGNYKITDLTELNNITAERVKDIEIMKHPGAQYGKDVESVIIIRLKSDWKEGFSLTNVLNLTATNRLSPSDKLTIGWKHDKLTLNAMVGWEQKSKNIEKKSFTYRYDPPFEKGKEPSRKDTKIMNTDNKVQTLSAGATAAYEFDPNNRISFIYALVHKHTDDTHIPEHTLTRIEDQETTHTTQTAQFNEHPATRHDFALEYDGHFGKWNLSVGNNSFIDNANLTMHKATMESYYKRKQFNVRTFAKASRTVWKGDLTFGAEHQFYNMDAKLYDDNPSTPANLAPYYKSHAKHPDNTLAAFISTQQTFGNWTIEAGVRYEHYNTIYRPCDDDALTYFFRNYTPKYIEQLKKAKAIAELLQRDGELKSHNDRFFPSLRVSTKIGGSELSLKHSEASIQPDFAITRLRLTETELWDKKVLWSEIVRTTTLGWKYKWVEFDATHKFFGDPICTTVSSTNKYNAPDYNALIFDLTLSPQIGIWSPMLNATFQKQWFDMPLASGKDRLKKPMGTITFNNTFTLPCNWLIRCNAFWHSRGANRNNYYFSSVFNIDASVQKSFPRLGLTFILSAQNLLYNTYNDYGRYTQDIYSVSEGAREHNPRYFSLTAQYKL